jgi:hypothetical protein
VGGVHWPVSPIIKILECLAYAACTASITGSGIDIVEDAEAFSRQFPLDAG